MTVPVAGLVAGTLTGVAVPAARPAASGTGSGGGDLLADGHALDVPGPGVIAPIAAWALGIESTASAGRLSLFTRACGLSSRESELLGHVVAGAATRDIAQLMFVSENTVQDHLKSIFLKTDTRTRRTLLARVLRT